MSVTMNNNVALTPISTNRKTGAMPVSYSTREWCPDDCPLKKHGCYAKHGHTGIHWRKVTAGERGTDWDTFVSKVRHLPKGGIWRHNVAGDLPVTKPGIMSTIGIGKAIQAAINEN